MSLPMSSLFSAFIALWAIAIAVKLVPPGPFESRTAKQEREWRLSFHNPSARKAPFSLLNDAQVQTQLLNPMRLPYLAQALRNTTCRHASSACFSSPDSRFLDVGCGAGLGTMGLANGHGFNMLGVDILDNAVNWATAHQNSDDGERSTTGGGEPQVKGTLEFRQGSTYSLPVADASVDGSLFPSLSLAL